MRKPLSQNTIGPCTATMISCQLHASFSDIRCVPISIDCAWSAQMSHFLGGQATAREHAAIKDTESHDLMRVCNFVCHDVLTALEYLDLSDWRSIRALRSFVLSVVGNVTAVPSMPLATSIKRCASLSVAVPSITWWTAILLSAYV